MVSLDDDMEGITCLGCRDVTMVVVRFVHGTSKHGQLGHFVFEVESSRRWNIIVLCGSACRTAALRMT